MAMAYECVCGKKYHIHEDYAGKPLQCDACGKTFTVGYPPVKKPTLNEIFAHRSRKQAGEKLFYQALCQALDDRILTLDEIEGLHDIAKEYGVTRERVGVLKVAYIKNKYKEAIADGVITEEEHEDTEKLRQELNLPEGIIPVHSGKYYRMHLIGTLQERGPEPLYSVSIKLPRGEECYWETSAELIERTKNRRRRYSGAAYLTNKKILFIGSGKSKTITWKRFLDYEVNRFGHKVYIYQSNRVNPIELRIPDPDLFGMFIDAILEST